MLDMILCGGPGKRFRPMAEDILAVFDVRAVLTNLSFTAHQVISAKPP